MKALIIASGTIEDYNILKREVEESDFILCVDGGVDHILNIGFYPDIVFGDLDSISAEGLAYIKQRNIPIRKFDSVKDSTDTELGLDYVISKDCKEITLMGVTGSRQDHTLANIFLLSYLLDRNIKGKIIDSNNIIYLTDDYLELEKLKDYYISVVPIVEEGINVSLKGFFYNLENKFIPFGSTLGVSNEIIEEYGKVKIHRGRAIVFQSKD